MKRILEQQTETDQQRGRMQETEDDRESDSVVPSFVEFNAAFTKDFSTKPRELKV